MTDHGDDDRDDRPADLDRALVRRLLSTVAAASHANALDHQLAQMLRAAFEASDPKIDVSDNKALGEAIEEVAALFREPGPSTTD